MEKSNHFGTKGESVKPADRQKSARYPAEGEGFNRSLARRGIQIDKPERGFEAGSATLTKHGIQPNHSPLASQRERGRSGMLRLGLHDS